MPPSIRERSSLKLWQCFAVASHPNSFGFESEKILQITYRQRSCQQARLDLHDIQLARRRALKNGSSKWYWAGEKRRWESMNKYRAMAGGNSGCPYGTYPRTPVRSLSNLTKAIPEFPCLAGVVLHGGCFSFFRSFGGEAVPPIICDRPIDDGSAVDAFPGIEGQKKVRESFQHHQSFALRAIHDYFLPCYETERAQGNSN
jgi:hypothetical protein